MKSKVYIVWLKRRGSQYGSVREVKSDCDLKVRDLIELFGDRYLNHYSVDELVKLLDEDYQVNELAKKNRDVSYKEINDHLIECIQKVVDALEEVKSDAFTKHFRSMLSSSITIPNKVTDVKSIKVRRTPSGLKVIQDSGIRI